MSIFRIYRFTKVKLFYDQIKCKSTLTTTKANIAEKLVAVIGLEIHAQIASASKLFSGAATVYGGPINSQVAFLDAALPGTLPVLNKRCVEAGILTALALNCHIDPVSTFDRKHYFYADLPAGYQITQQREPLGKHGLVHYLVNERGRYVPRSARITQLQLEQDSGKSLHDTEAGYSLIDLNRAGMALMEIVTEPDFRSGEEAAAFVKELQLMLLTLGTCDGKMEEGSMRVDASVSLHHEGEPLGTRSEVKNINSTRYVAQAIEYEIKRQTKVLESGGRVANETRSFDYETRKTVPMRDKERLHDYRFMPEPNLPPLWFYSESEPPSTEFKEQAICIDNYAVILPELPQETRQRLTEQHGLKVEQAVVIVNEPGMLAYFEGTMQHIGDTVSGQAVANLLCNQLLALLNKDDLLVSRCPVMPSHCAELLQLLHHKTSITTSTAKQVLAQLYDEQSKRSPASIVNENKWHIITDEGILEDIVRQVLENNPKAIKQVKKGKKKVVGFLVGEAQKICQDCAHYEVLNRVMQKLLIQQ